MYNIEENSMANYIYIRVSTKNQDLQSQQNELKQYANDKMMAIDEVFGGVYSSTKSGDERQVTVLKNRIKSGDCILISEVSRLGRSLVEVMGFIQEMTSKGVRLIFIHHNIDTNYEELTHSDFILLANLAMMAEVEKRFIIQRTKSTLQRKKEQGIKVGRPVNDKGTFSRSKFDQHRHDIELLLKAGKSVREIAKMLGYKNHSGIQNYIISRKLKT